MSAESDICCTCDETEHISRNCTIPAENNTSGYTKRGKKDSKKKPSGTMSGTRGGGGVGEGRWSVQNYLCWTKIGCGRLGSPSPC